MASHSSPTIVAAYAMNLSTNFILSNDEPSIIPFLPRLAICQPLSTLARLALKLRFQLVKTARVSGGRQSSGSLGDGGVMR